MMIAAMIFRLHATWVHSLKERCFEIEISKSIDEDEIAGSVLTKTE